MRIMIKLFLQEQCLFFTTWHSATLAWLGRGYWVGISAIAGIIGTAIAAAMLFDALTPSYVPTAQSTVSEALKPATGGHSIRGSTIASKLQHNPVRSLSADAYLSSMGGINLPVRNTLVDPQFSSSGTISLKKGETAWLAVRKGKLYWPKESPVETSGAWKRTVYEGGPPGPFELTLLSVDRAANERIIAWFEKGSQTGQYPGILLGKSTKILDKVNIYLEH